MAAKIVPINNHRKFIDHFKNSNFIVHNDHIVFCFVATRQDGVDDDANMRIVRLLELYLSPQAFIRITQGKERLLGFKDSVFSVFIPLNKTESIACQVERTGAMQRELFDIIQGMVNRVYSLDRHICKQIASTH